MRIAWDEHGPAALAACTEAHAFLVAPGVVPRDDALERLLAADADIACCLVRDPSGVPVDRDLPAGAEGDTARVLRLVAERRLPIRSAPFAATLVRTALVREHGVPDVSAFGAHAPVAWTARVLAAGASGLLVAEAVATRAVPPPPAGLAETVRMARTGGAWTRGEQVRAVADAVTGSRPRSPRP